MKKLTFSLFFLLSLTSLKCTKEPAVDQLPPITTSGANTFGCLVNGNVWLPYGGFNINAITVYGFIGHSYKNPEFDIYTRNRKNNAQSDIDITIRNFKDTGTYLISNQLNTGLVYSDGTISFEPFDTFGAVQITRCDTIQNIVSGTFSFIGYSDNNHTTKVNITDGRFDVHYPLTIH